MNERLRRKVAEKGPESARKRHAKLLRIRKLADDKKRKANERSNDNHDD